MTQKDLEKIFDEVQAEVYSPEYQEKIEEKIKKANGFGDSGMDKLALSLVAAREQDKAFMFRVLAQVLCEKS